MYHHIAFFLCISIIVTVNAQTVNVRGKVSNQAGKPVSNAIVTLLRQGLKDTTGSDGAYLVSKNNVAVLPPLVPRTGKISLNRGVLELRLANTSPVKVEIFDVKGKLLKKEFVRNALAGVYRLNISENTHSVNVLIIHVSIGLQVMTFRYLPLHNGISHNGKYAVTSSGDTYMPAGGRLAKIAADADSLMTTADGYMAKTVIIASYDTTLDITLDTAAGTVCEGCGKTDHPVSGKATIDVDGTKREYTLLLPDNYVPGKQYKLIFCPHWLGGTMNDVVSGQSCNGPYYGLKALANNTAIFVAPNGLKGSMGTGWENKNGSDIKFFKAMLKYFNSTLCIDQKRIFSVGFSYGGMMSFAISCSMSDVFRAIAPMSGSLYSGCDNTADHPIAMWQAHGNNDKTVPLADGKKGLDIVLEKNGCGTQTTPVDPSPCVQYQGCKEGYPVVFCEFSGGHGVQNFAAAAIWTFFSQF
jgi:polyhydroxybutyrate depolymerase